MEKALALLEQLIEFSIVQDKLNPEICPLGGPSADGFMTFHLKVLKDLLKNEE